MSSIVTNIPAKRLDPSKFPHPPSPPSSGLPGTMENLAHLLRGYGISSRFDVIRKSLTVVHDNGKPASLGEVASLANLNRFTSQWLQHFLQEIGNSNPLNPVRDWIGSRPWDGQDRFREFCETVTARDDYPGSLKPVLLHKWLLSAVAAALLDKPFKARGVLTLQGGQGVGKTSWVSKLVPEGPLRRGCIKLDHHLDGSNKDSVIGAISSWITEIGELDSSFKKDVARLKGFLTADGDKLRPPYAKEPIHYPRRTVFAATVNDEHFLVDHIGNSRWWTISCEKLEFDHDIEMQQLFAQLAVDLSNGKKWWLTGPEEKVLAGYNLRHRSMSATSERIRDAIDVEQSLTGKGRYVTPTEFLKDIGISHPRTSDPKECGAILRELLGPPKRVQGRDRWRVVHQREYVEPAVY